MLREPQEIDEEGYGFRLSGREITPSEKKKWPGVLIMETCSDANSTTDDRREFLIPLVGLRALKHVEYSTLARSILQANPGSELTYSDMQLLWDAIIHKAYNFVCACEREAKAMEVSDYRLWCVT